MRGEETEMVEVRGAKIKLVNGHLDDNSQWNPEVAKFLAQRDEVVLSEKHWEIINFARGYFEKFQLPPFPKIFYKGVFREVADIDCVADVYKLFPLGYKSVLIYAGLPEAY